MTIDIEMLPKKKSSIFKYLYLTCYVPLFIISFLIVAVVFVVLFIIEIWSRITKETTVG